ncbi:hypothetical protein RCL1_000421 [Eukaryota sp. TZLM3-RCL]
MLDNFQEDAVTCLFDDAIKQDSTDTTRIILSSIQDLIRDQKLSPSPTSYYAAFLSTLLGHASLTPEKLSSTLYLLAAVIPSVPASVIQRQSERNGDVLLDILRTYVENETLIPAAVNATVSFLSLLPSSSFSSSVKSLFDLIFYFLTHPNTVIQTRSIRVIPKLFTNAHSLSETLLNSLLEFVNSVVLDVTKSPDSAIKAFSLCNSVSEFIPAETTWKLIELALKLKNTRASGSAYDFIISALTEFNFYDSTLIEAYLSKFPCIFESFLGVLADSSKLATTGPQVQKRCVSLLKSLGKILTQNPSDLELATISQVSSSLQRLFNIKTRPVWANLFNICNILFSITNSAHSTSLSALVQYITSVLDDAYSCVTKSNNIDNSKSYNESLLKIGKNLFASIIKTIGLEKVLFTYAALNLDPASAQGCSRPWLVWSIVHGSEFTRLDVFTDHLLPLSLFLSSKAAELRAKIEDSSSPLMKSVADIEHLSFQIIETLPGICKYPTDFSENWGKILNFFNDVFALKFGPNYLLPASRALHNLISTCCVSSTEEIRSVFDHRHGQSNLLESDEIDDFDNEFEQDSDTENPENMIPTINSETKTHSEEYIATCHDVITPHCKQLLVLLLQVFSSTSKTCESNQTKSEARKQLLEAIFVVSIISPLNGILAFLSETIKRVMTSFNQIIQSLEQKLDIQRLLGQLHVNFDLLHVFSLASFFRNFEVDISLPLLKVSQCCSALTRLADSSLHHKIFRLSSFLSSIDNDQSRLEISNLTVKFNISSVPAGARRSFLRLCSSLVPFSSFLTLSDWINQSIQGLSDPSTKARLAAHDLLLNIINKFNSEGKDINEIISNLLGSDTVTAGVIMALTAVVSNFSHEISKEVYSNIGTFLNNIFYQQSSTMTSEFARSLLFLLKRLLLVNSFVKILEENLLPNTLFFFKCFYQCSGKTPKYVKFLLEKFVKKFGEEKLISACTNVPDFAKAIKSVSKSLRQKKAALIAKKAEKKSSRVADFNQDVVVPTSIDLLDSSKLVGMDRNAKSRQDSTQNHSKMIVEVDGRLIIGHKPDSNVDNSEDSATLDQVIRTNSLESEAKSNRKRSRGDGEGVKRIAKRINNDSNTGFIRTSEEGVPSAFLSLNPAQLNKRGKKESAFNSLIKAGVKGAKNVKKRR